MEEDVTTRLQAARHQRGWSQAKLIAVLRAQALTVGMQLPGTKSMTALLSRWENGHVVPNPTYAALLRAVFGMTDSELGLAPARDGDVTERPAADALLRDLASARAIGPDEVLLLQRQTDSYRLLDRPLGAPRLLEPMRGHIAALGALLGHSVRDEHRRPLARVLADTASLAGWQALDVGAPAQSWQHFEMAKSAAREAEDWSLLAYASGEQAYVLLDLDRRRDAVAMIENARTLGASRAHPRVRLWLAAAEGELRAAAGESVSALRAFDLVEDVPDPAEDDPPYLALGRPHLERWRGNVLALVGHGDALPCLTSALAGMDADFRRATAGLHCDLALAWSANGDRDASLHHAREARRIADEVGSVRQARRVSRLRLVA
jgi:transcriptional regulator with XRE-family HTH domain